MHARFQILDRVFLRNVDAAALVLVFQRALRVDTSQQRVLHRALRAQLAMVDVDLVVIIWLLGLMVILSELDHV